MGAVVEQQGREQVARPAKEGMSDERFAFVCTSIVRVVLTVIVGAVVLGAIRLFQPIVSDLAGEKTDVQVDFVVQASIAINVMLGGGAVALWMRLRQANRRISDLEGSPKRRSSGSSASKRGTQKKRR